MLLLSGTRRGYGPLVLTHRMYRFDRVQQGAMFDYHFVYVEDWFSFINTKKWTSSWVPSKKCITRAGTTTAFCFGVNSTSLNLRVHALLPSLGTITDRWRISSKFTQPRGKYSSPCFLWNKAHCYVLISVTCVDF